MVCLFCAFNINGDMKKFVQISTFLVLFNKIEIWSKFLESPEGGNIDNTKKTRLENARIRRILWLLFQESVRGKVGSRLNVTHKFKVQKRLSSRLATVMFRMTPCTIPEWGGVWMSIMYSGKGLWSEVYWKRNNMVQFSFLNLKWKGLYT